LVTAVTSAPRLGNLNRERAYSTTSAVDQYFVSWLNVTVIAERL
jgi:hypothetical protein